MFIVHSIKKGYCTCCASKLLIYVLFVAGTAIASSLMDKQGRKSLLVVSFSGMVIITFITHLFEAKLKNVKILPDRFVICLKHHKYNCQMLFFEGLMP